MAMLRAGRKKERAPGHRRYVFVVVGVVVLLLLGLAYELSRKQVLAKFHWPWWTSVKKVVISRPHHKPGPRTSFPWKKGVVTTVFWIGEGAIGDGSTTQVSSAWDQNWRDNNGGVDTPGSRDGYGPAGHAFQVNPFYVALPFNDLAWPDLAKEWVPTNWKRPSKNSRRVSGCRGRWVQIKNAAGKSCFAQWDDVGPGRTDAVEYVFGDDDAGSRPGLDISPAVAQYLGIDGRAITSWRFVDEEDVKPGEWLKYNEMALLYRAINEAKSPAVAPVAPAPTEVIEAPNPGTQ